MASFWHRRARRPNRGPRIPESWHGFCDIPHAPVVASDQGRRLVIGTGASHAHAGDAEGPVVGGLPAPFFCAQDTRARKKPGLAGLFVRRRRPAGPEQGGSRFPHRTSTLNLYCRLRQKATQPVNSCSQPATTAGGKQRLGPLRGPGSGFALTDGVVRAAGWTRRRGRTLDPGRCLPLHPLRAFGRTGRRGRRHHPRRTVATLAHARLAGRRQRLARPVGDHRL